MELVSSAAARLGIAMPIATVEGEVLGPFGVNAIPSTVFVAPDGTIVAAASGVRTEKFFRARVRELLGPD